MPNQIQGPPSFTFIQPNSSTLTLPNNSTQQGFDAFANDPITPISQLDYRWYVDTNPVFEATGSAGEHYQTTGATLGTNPPNHDLEVLVSDAMNLTTAHHWSITVQ